MLCITERFSHCHCKAGQYVMSVVLQDRICAHTNLQTVETEPHFIKTRHLNTYCIPSKPH
jgi:hypothetical protein